MKRIVIGCSPRTGSSLLQKSLAAHPVAVTGGEWFNPILAEVDPVAWQNKQAGVYCNLIKVFGYESNLPGYDEVLRSGVLIHLYRADRAAQLASWHKACQTGRWVNEHSPGDFVFEFPGEYADAMIDQSDALAERADLSLSYERLTTHWDESIAAILELAMWPPMVLPMAMTKLEGS